MQVELAGLNVPKILLDKLKNCLSESEISALTPEVLSAAYARISRSEKSVKELVDDSARDVATARKSNEAIIFGMGHHSVADHAIFNFNITGVSRLVVEGIEKRRLAGYTEKSQRYVTLQGDYIKPKEFNPEDLKRFEKLIQLQNNFYFETNKKLLEHLKKKIPKAKIKDLEGSAKEDARYSLSLATETQLGCSYTGETAELAIRELKYGELEEEREFAKMLYNAVVKVAPSLIQLTDPELFKKHNPGQELKDDNFKLTRKNLKTLAEKTFSEYANRTVEINNITFFKNKDVTLVHCNDIDTNIISAILHANSNQSIQRCYEVAYAIKSENKGEKFIKDALKHISEFDKLPREFEVTGLIYELIVSAGCFGQLKRHRMNTLLSQDYNPELGYTIPPNIEEIGLANGLKEVCDASTELYFSFLPRYRKASQYCLTNAHRRRVILATNLRQLYHISRTRGDLYAQWDIRDKTEQMSELAKQLAPSTTLLLGGKHKFKTFQQDNCRD